jgi:hypothetical protein
MDVVGKRYRQRTAANVQLHYIQNGRKQFNASRVVTAHSALYRMRGWKTGNHDHYNYCFTITTPFVISAVVEFSSHALLEFLQAVIMQIVHNIDPSADTVIILKYPLAFFAVWTESDVGEDGVVEDGVVEDGVVEDGVVEDGVVEDGVVEDGVVEDGVVEDTVAEQATDIELSAQEPNPSEVSTSEEEIHYHVSSRHLRLASTRFESMLSRGNWKEGLPNEKDGLYHISAEDWDKEALLILLNVLHHHNRQVPRSVSLEMLARIAVLIDYYDCAEAVEFCTERWVESLRKTSTVPLSLCRELLLWMCIAWVLRLPHEFTQATAVAIKGNGRLSTLGLPITSCIGKWR